MLACDWIIRNQDKNNHVVWRTSVQVGRKVRVSLCSQALGERMGSGGGKGEGDWRGVDYGIYKCVRICLSL